MTATPTPPEPRDTAKEQAQAQYQSIVDMMNALDGKNWERYRELVNDKQYYPDDFTSDMQEELDDLTELYAEYAGDFEDVENAIYERPLSVEFRSGWETRFEDPVEPQEMRVVMCTNGPHVEVRADLCDGDVSNAYIQYQDWGSPMTHLFPVDRSILNAFMQRLVAG